MGRARNGVQVKVFFHLPKNQGKIKKKLFEDDKNQDVSWHNQAGGKYNETKLLYGGQHNSLNF